MAAGRVVDEMTRARRQGVRVMGLGYRKDEVRFRVEMMMSS